jgi:hypothetical protein
MKLLLELFKGSGSVGTIARKKGFDTLSLDFDEEFEPDILTDILKWDYKKMNIRPEFIWASPPCNTYSTLAYPLRERDPKTAEPLSERAVIGTKILYKTIEIIKYFLKKNPNMGFVIENPRGMMRYDKKIKEFIYNFTYYCNYNDDRTKPTNFFSNYPLYLDPTICRGPKTAYIENIPLLERYKIPPKLTTHIIDEYLKLKKV